MDNTTTIHALKAAVQKIMDERDWAQFHSPKNMSMDIAAEAAELMELFLWCDTDSSKLVLEEKRQQVENEVADIFMALLRLSQLYNIDLSKAVEHKLVDLARKYPVEKTKGIAKKYTEL